jgi:oxygen-dependent protoporphyrinogen oxidase
LSEIVEGLVESLEKSGAQLWLGSTALEVSPISAGYTIQLASGKSLFADNVIFATPPYVTADLVEGFAPVLADELRTIEYVSTATVTLAYPETALKRPLDGYGYVIPRSEGRKALACTWTSTKFPHRAPEGFALLRVFIGRAGQEEDIPWDEDSLLKIARDELASTLGITAQPLFNRVYRWQDAMPQYNLGHQERLARIEIALEAFPRLALAGNGYQGIGIPDCIHSGEQAAERILATTKLKASIN